jgi:hypothetical protein
LCHLESPAFAENHVGDRHAHVLEHDLAVTTCKNTLTHRRHGRTRRDYSLFETNVMGSELVRVENVVAASLATNSHFILCMVPLITLLPIIVRS